MDKSGESGDGRQVELLLEVSPKSASGDLAPRVAVPEEFHRRAAEVADSVAEVVDHFRSRLERVLKYDDDAHWGVDSIEIGFDIAVQAEAGVVIAKASTGATLTVGLTLKSRRKQQ